MPVVSAEDYEMIVRELAGCKPDATPCPPEKIADMLASTAVIHPDARLNVIEQRSRLRTYIKTLKDIPEEVLALAFAECAKTIKFFPKPAEIRAVARRVLNERWLVYRALDMMRVKHELQFIALPEPDDHIPSKEERDEFNALMRGMRIKMRLFEDGTMRALESGETDPAPEPAP